MHDINHQNRILTPSAPDHCSRLADHGDGLRRCHGFNGRGYHPQGEAEGSSGFRAQGRCRRPRDSRRHPVGGADAGSGLADLGLSRTLEAFRPIVGSEDPSADQLRRELTDRVGSLSWVMEGVVQSIAMSDLDAATRLWGDEAIDLLWERKLLVSPDGNPDHRDVHLSDDAQAWASARRAELVLAAKPPGQKPSRLEHLALTGARTEHQGEHRKRGPVLVGVHR